MYLDISSMRKPSMGGRQHWVMLVDEATKYKKSFFLKKKNEQVEPITDWIKALKARHKIQVKIIRCDNAGENKVLERESDKKELGIIFEYTAPGTPQQNGVVERAFVTVGQNAEEMNDGPCNDWGVGIPIVDPMDLLSSMYVQSGFPFANLLRFNSVLVLHGPDCI